MSQLLTVDPLFEGLASTSQAKMVGSSNGPDTGERRAGGASCVAEEGEREKPPLYDSVNGSRGSLHGRCTVPARAL